MKHKRYKHLVKRKIIIMDIYFLKRKFHTHYFDCFFIKVIPSKYFTVKANDCYINENFFWHLFNKNFLKGFAIWYLTKLGRIRKHLLKLNIKREKEKHE